MVGASEAFGGVDCLVNNAGIPKRTPVPRLTPSDIAHVMDVNFRAGAHDARCCPIGSTGGRLRGERVEPRRTHPIAHEAAYCASKFALCGWSETMAVDLHGTGVEVKLMLPGPIETEIWDQPDNDPAPFNGPFVPALDCAAAILWGWKARASVLRARRVPGGFGFQRRRREQDRRHRRLRRDDGCARRVRTW